MTVGILGLGLIGGSLARAYKKEGHKVLCSIRSEQKLAVAMEAGAVDALLTPDNMHECDLILLAIYPEGSTLWLEKNAPYIRKDTLVIDCCGVKRDICSRCFPVAKEYGFTFIGGHPMAGTHKSGFAFSKADMFCGAPMVLVPDHFDDPQLIEWAKKMLEPCHFGFYSVTTAEDHDSMIAFTSQMPHIISNAYIKSPTALRHKGFSAGSYKDLTRVAWLNAQMWAELFMENKDNVINELNVLIDSLKQYRTAIEQDDLQTLTVLLEEGKRRKEEVDG